ncbi:bifunctional 3-deoxy-7-phosphoheptulonate synthase/chorismate mutase type II [Aureispira anguillae]|uniref:chorismate mutase n=1 Tax=Aureispira anguillae TaxID=2864201 RepID=A0A915VKE6_9BACT|nr:bifunctional 3-deoxy-7-phosphoheptulonate synthase/chorismate mutase type II [Aureispira anguillae]BDS09667.1 bifunctional 3-deoxy-7-phosphoheptulonate synthase/chorismate mutase type II [Aureispira anguillae]
MKITTWKKNDLNKPMLIAGPCSAESRMQVLETAKKLKEQNLAYFRAGIWKPRTRPGAFEGVGTIGLSWLQEAKKLYQLPICTEVANVKHVYEALKAGMDMLWIGARTSTNPFAVQEIAEALRGVDIPIMVKNPINPDLKLWIGAIERFEKCGIQNIAAIHRGFSIYEKIDYRNQPKWQIAVDLQREYPDMLMICDPSHIGGKRAHILKISQKALDLNFDGLMIETHHQPQEAWTDAAQQITPKQLMETLEQLIIRDKEPTEVALEELEELRGAIRNLDKELIQLLSDRMSISEKIGHYKKLNNMTILQNSQWEKLLDRNMKQAENAHIAQHFTTKLFKLIHQESINVQEQVLTKDN